MLTRDRLAADLQRLGVTPGGTLLVHSSLKRLGPVEGGPATVVAALRDALGPGGLLVVPTHTWGTVNAAQPVFHELHSPSIVGHLTNHIRRLPAAVRSLHPTHSVAALGRDAAAFVAGHETQDTPCAKDSPYGRLVDRDGQVLLLGVDLGVCTLFHAFEEWAQLPWLFSPVPEPLVTITREGREISVPSRRHGGEGPGWDRDYPALEARLRAAGVLAAGPVGPAACLLLQARPAADLLVPLLRAEPRLVLRRQPGP